MNLAHSLDYYIGQILFIKTTDDDILMVKVLGKIKMKRKGYKIGVLESNGENIKLDMVIYNEEIKRICILPTEVQKGIELTRSHMPLNIFKDIENLTSVVEFGKREEDE